MRRPLLIVLAFVGCTVDEPMSPGIDGISHVETYELPAVLPPKIDLLFVIDDTTAMAPYQDRIAALPALTAQMVSEIHGGVPDIRIAVTTNGGALRTAAGLADPWLAEALGEDFLRHANYDGALADALVPLMNVGAVDTGASQPLAALRDVLEGASGFVRDNAYLGILTIAASDDASAAQVTDYVDAMKAFKADPNTIVFGGIYAKPATRLDAFHAAFPNRSHTIAIDDTDWMPALSLAGQLIKVTLGVRCFEEPADLDPITPGPQYDCAMEVVSPGAERVLPQCREGGAEPCFYFEADPQSCFDDDATVQLKVRGYTGRFHPHVRGQCLVN